MKLILKIALGTFLGLAALAVCVLFLIVLIINVNNRMETRQEMIRQEMLQNEVRADISPIRRAISSVRTIARRVLSTSTCTEERRAADAALSWVASLENTIDSLTEEEYARFRSYMDDSMKRLERLAERNRVRKQHRICNELDMSALERHIVYLSDIMTDNLTSAIR